MISEIEVEELVGHWADIDIDADDNYEETLSEWLQENYDVELDSFTQILQRVFKGLSLNISPMTNEPYIGISSKNRWLIKKELSENDFIGNIMQYITENEPLTQSNKGYSKDIAVDGEVKYKLLLTHGNIKISLDWEKENEKD